MRTKKTSCVYCGAAPIPHAFLFIDSTISIISEKMALPFMRPFMRIFDPLFTKIAVLFLHILQFILEKVGLITYTDEVYRAVSHRTEAVWEEAKRRGIRMQNMLIGGKCIEQSRAWIEASPGSSKKTWKYFQSIPIPPWKDVLGSPFVDNKETFKRIMSTHGLPVPQGGSAMTLSAALRRFRSINKPVIVKPQSGSRARHTTVNLTDEVEFREAFRRAQQLCLFVVVEECIVGQLYRATCVDGVLHGVVEFIKPAVTADGVHTIEELRHYHNNHKKFPNLTDLKDDAWFRDALIHQGYSPESVPQRGTRVLLSEHSERPNGGYFIDRTNDIPQEIIRVIEKAARVCQAPVVGFDIISPDLGNLKEAFVFIEANQLPYIELHSIPYEGIPRHVASAVWDMWTSSELQGPLDYKKI